MDSIRGSFSKALLMGTIVFLFLGFAIWSGVNSAPSPAENHRQVLKAYAGLPLAFVENRGQTDSAVRFYAEGSRYAFHLMRDAAMLSFLDRSDATRGVALALRFVGANERLTVVGEDRAPGEVNYFQGSDASHWLTGLPRYSRVVYRELWPGVDMMLRGDAGQLKYEFRVRPGARHEAIRLAYDGADGLTLDDAGVLLIKTPLGVLRDSPPVAYQTIAGTQVPIDSHYVLRDRAGSSGEYGIAIGAGYDPEHELIIDPSIDYSTFLGGSAGDNGEGIVVDADGNAYIVGTTQSLDFPTTAGAFDRTLGNPNNAPDAFVSKLNLSGSALIYSTYLGGTEGDRGRAIAIDANGNAYITGKTDSENFPTTPDAFDTTANIDPNFLIIDDGFVAKLNASGSSLVYSTYLGGTENDEPRAIAVDAQGNAYVTGETVSAGFPTTPGAFDTVRSGEFDVFVTKLNAAGTGLVYSTFLGGLVSDIANGVAVDSAGNAFVTGSTRSSDFPTTPGAFDTTHNGMFDVFVAKLNPAGSALVSPAPACRHSARIPCHRPRCRRCSRSRR